MRLRWVVGGVGVLTVGVAALVALGTELEPVAETLAPLVTALAGLGSQRLVLASAAVTVLGLVVSLLVPGGERVLADDGGAERFERLLDRPPESATRTAPRTGAALDDDVARAVAGDERALSVVRGRLRDLTATALADGAVDSQSAAELVASGEWTDDRAAAAFLAEGDPTASLRSRLRLWLDPETERERRLRRTATAVDRLVDGEAGAAGARVPESAGDAARVRGEDALSTSADDAGPGTDRPTGGSTRARRETASGGEDA